MKTRAALTYETDQAWDVGKELWKIEELTINRFEADDVLVHLTSSGVCHTDLHMITGDLPPAMLPMIGGHEAAGIVEDVGANVTHVKPGDHVILSIMPCCGECRFCRSGMSHLCVRAMNALAGHHPDGQFRYRNANGQDVGQWSLVGSFAEYVVTPRDSVIKIDDDLPFDKASLVGCAVTTGFGAAVDRAKVRPGDTVVVWGCGGVGLSAVQGAVLSGAADVIAIDINDFKLEKAREFGATVTLNPNRDRSPNPFRDETAEKVMEFTNWVGADSALLTVDYITPELVGAGFESIRNGGMLVLVGVSNPRHNHLPIMPLNVTFTEKIITGCVYGSGNPAISLPRNLRLYQKGKLKLDEMITNEYALEDVNQAFEDLLNGTNVKSILRF